MNTVKIVSYFKKMTKSWYLKIIAFTKSMHVEIFKICQMNMKFNIIYFIHTWKPKKNYWPFSNEST